MAIEDEVKRMGGEMLIPSPKNYPPSNLGVGTPDERNAQNYANFEINQEAQRGFGQNPIANSEYFAVHNPTRPDTYPHGPAGLNLTGWDNRISPELQSIIDKVSGSSTMQRGQREAMAHLGGVLGGLETQRRNDESQMKRLGVTGAQDLTKQRLTGVQDLEKQRITEAGATTRANIVTAPGIAEQNRKNQPVGGILPKGPPPEEGPNWWERNKSKMFEF